MRVLVVDDNALHLLILRKIFEKSSATVVIANNGKEALDELKKDPAFHVILTDIMMPEMDGIELLSQVKQDTSTNKIPVIGFTAGDVDYYRQHTPVPFDTLVPKPIDFWELYNLAKAKAHTTLN
ncbi:Response regulator receiver domain-containing protein [Algoriphagus faecimaris]|uniref:Response regulator receiver domain-containing protein n=1 Tax=Algoriphagus faecimaris TaxID=686796 RepID=A0A1G6QE67_9BACT|nr:response regulator [Algoriphagus faecimaris]SDC90603.1 Response regulator receiver domain-containing protein [Algoriphagus faecimaris]